MVETWETLVAKKQAEAADKIPSAWRLPSEYTVDVSETSSLNVLDIPRRSGLLSEKQLEITETNDATSLLEKIRKQELSAYEVTEAFCIRAAIAQQLTCCLTETLFDRALNRAKELDDHLTKTGQVVGPLHDPWRLDSSVISSPWREVKPKSTFRLGLIVEDSHFPIHPPVQRTLNEAVKKLEAAGHEIVALNPPSIRDALVLAFRMFAMDPEETAFKHIAASGEPTIPALASTALPHEYLEEEHLPRLLTLYTSWGPSESSSKRSSGRSSRKHKWMRLSCQVLWNVMDYPASIVPFGKADKAADAPFVRDVYYKPPYKPDEIEGAPCCVQVVTRNMQDEELVNVTRAVADVLGSQ
ncbi:Amidase [Penicillium chermesinum]|uniref:Amidase n=1 Tax=Penicillium chermesinum TaxID=63820 RepID=A0A9W9NSL9_9EURO|nr:Amidase [Penicillium chermesinum]KAJ5223914.1 Amidase [Penicillium chermesinum]